MTVFFRIPEPRTLLLFVAFLLGVAQAETAFAALELELNSSLHSSVLMSGCSDELPMVVEGSAGSADMQSVLVSSSTFNFSGLLGLGYVVQAEADGVWIRWQRDRLDLMYVPLPIEVVPRVVRFRLHT